MADKPLPPNTVAKIILGEAASEGPEGLRFVLDTMVTRARAQKKTLEQVATAPKQFSAYARPDLDRFYAQQPMMLRTLADLLVQEALDPAYQPKYNYSHYVSNQFWEDRGKLKPDHWIHSYEPAEVIGGHTALRPRRRK